MDLVDGCIKQDVEAQRQFYKAYYKMVYNSCYRILPNPMDAEDCMQETFIKAFDKINTLKDMPVEAWLRRIAINTALDKLKQDKMIWEDIKEQHYSYIEETSDEDCSEWQVEQVKFAITKLPEAFRIVLSLYLFEGYDHQEIAEILSLKETTVRSQYARAKQRLIEIIKKEQILCVSKNI